VRRFPVIQRRQSDADPRALDADVYYPESIVVPKAWQEFDEQGRMKPSPWYDRIVDVSEELFKITQLLKGHTPLLAGRYSERKESHQALSARVNQAKI
jgi:arsenic resistance protein ArsH